MIYVYGDDGADANKERVIAVSVIAGREEWWQSVEDQWVVRCGGIPFSTAAHTYLAGLCNNVSFV